MSGKRIIQPEKWPYFDYRSLPYSLAVEKGGFVFISGQTAEREDPATGKIECQGNLAEQMSVVMEKHKLLMEAAGARPDDLVQRHIFRSSGGCPAVAHQQGFTSNPSVGREAWGQYFGDHYAPGTGLFMQGNLNLRAIVCSDLTLDMGPGEKRYINPGFPPDPQRAIDFYEQGTNRPGVVKNNVVWTAGQAPWYLGRDGNVGSHETLQEQTRFLFEKFEGILKGGGATMDDVIMTRDYIVPAARPYYRSTGEIRREFLGKTFPASTGVICVALYAPDWLIEINMVAVKGGKKEVVLAEQALGQGLTFMPGVKKGNLFFLSGMTGPDPATGKVRLGDIEAQTREIYKSIAATLEAGGASFDDVVKVTDYIDEAGLPEYRKAAQVRREYFGDSLPAATTTVCNRLLDPNALIEVEAIAVID